MRTFGRVYDEEGNATWVEVDTDARGFNDAVYLTTLCQYLKLNLGESPFFGDAGIPQFQSIMTQVFPDFYVNLAQQQFAQFFASLIITKEKATTPIYDIAIQSNSGANLGARVAT